MGGVPRPPRIILLFLFTATSAISFMDTNGASAFRTSPSCFFMGNKFSYTQFLYILKILDHAYMVFSSIPFIQMAQNVARKFLTFKTNPCFSFLKNFAVFDFTSSTSNGFMGICSPATETFILFSQISHANTTIHSAGCDKRCFIY
jgi:hypothetical protein